MSVMVSVRTDLTFDHVCLVLTRNTAGVCLYSRCGPLSVGLGEGTVTPNHCLSDVPWPLGSRVHAPPRSLGALLSVDLESDRQKQVQALLCVLCGREHICSKNRSDSCLCGGGKLPVLACPHP